MNEQKSGCLLCGNTFNIFGHPIHGRAFGSDDGETWHIKHVRELNGTVCAFDPETCSHHIDLRDESIVEGWW